MNKDMQQIWTLLDIMHKTVNVPKLKGLHDWAETELVGIQEDYPSHNELKDQVASLTGSLKTSKLESGALKDQIEQLQAELSLVKAENESLKAPSIPPMNEQQTSEATQ